MSNLPSLRERAVALPFLKEMVAPFNGVLEVASNTTPETFFWAETEIENSTTANAIRLNTRTLDFLIQYF